MFGSMAPGLNMMQQSRMQPGGNAVDNGFIARLMKGDPNGFLASLMRSASAPNPNAPLPPGWQGPLPPGAAPAAGGPGMGGFASMGGDMSGIGLLSRMLAGGGGQFGGQSGAPRFNPGDLMGW